MKRHDVLNWFVERFDHKRYLEIGCAGDHTFREIKAANKTGVDPRQGGTHRMTSDEFFRDGHAQTYDLVFVDGLHHRDQVTQDVFHAKNCLSPGGIIILDDCRPREEKHQIVETPQGEPIFSPPTNGPWTGDVWKAVVDLRQRPDLDLCVLDVIWGMGVIVMRPNTKPLPMPSHALNWAEYANQKSDLLRLVDWNGLEAFLDLP